MQIVIDIPDMVYNLCVRNEYLFYNDTETIKRAIKNGISLPKGHGRLIDADAYREEMLNSREFDFFKRLDMQSTIIEADKIENKGVR